jgi:hypothetical protein
MCAADHNSTSLPADSLARSSGLSACLIACRPAPACLPVCLPACLPACLPDLRLVGWLVGNTRWCCGCCCRRGSWMRSGFAWLQP